MIVKNIYPAFRVDSNSQFDYEVRLAFALGSGYRFLLGSKERFNGDLHEAEFDVPSEDLGSYCDDAFTFYNISKTRFNK